MLGKDDPEMGRRLDIIWLDQFKNDLWIDENYSLKDKTILDWFESDNFFDGWTKGSFSDPNGNVRMDRIPGARKVSEVYSTASTPSVSCTPSAASCHRTVLLDQTPTAVADRSMNSVGERINMDINKRDRPRIPDSGFDKQYSGNASQRSVNPESDPYHK